MRAAWYEAYGPAEEVLRVGERDTPEPGHGEVRVRLRCSAVNPSDTKKRAGQQAGILDSGAVIPHSDGAGVIDATGPGVPKARIGERVWVYQAQFRRQYGTAAGYVCLPAARAVRLPDNTSFEIGACMGIPAMTAHRCVLADGDVDGRTVLVAGGAGRVGHYAIQWAKWGGARVIASAGSDERARHCRDAGADAVVNYRTDDLVAAVADITGGDGADRVIDVEFGANIEAMLKLVRTGGVIASYSSDLVAEARFAYRAALVKDVTLRFVLVYVMPESAKRQAIADIIRYLAEGKLAHRIAESYPLADIANAHLAIERGGVPGCVVVEAEPVT